MNLENALFELATLVDYGTYYLSKKKEFTTEDALHFLSFGSVDVDTILDNIDSYDLNRYFGRYGGWDALDEFPTNEIYDYLKTNYSMSNNLYGLDIDPDDVLKEMGNSDVTEYVRAHFDANDIYDAEEMLDCLNEDSIRSYVVASGFDIENWVEANLYWK